MLNNVIVGFLIMIMLSYEDSMCITCSSVSNNHCSDNIHALMLQRTHKPAKASDGEEKGQKVKPQVFPYINCWFYVISDRFYCSLPDKQY